MKWFFVTLFNVIIGMANFFLTPVNTFVANVFPSFTDQITLFTRLINTYLGGSLSYFFSILPPNTRILILLYISLLISGYTVTFAIHVVLKVIHVIREIKIW